jgi:hypothetical protein
MDGNNDYIIVQILKNFLGDPKSEVDALNKKQWQFNCPGPTCRHDVDKFNLEYNSQKKAFKCWKCEPRYSGYVHKLVSDYGSQDDYRKLNLIFPKENIKTLRKDQNKRPKVDHDLITCKMPKGYMPLGKKRNSKLYQLAWDYLTITRAVAPGFIDKYEIGYTETGPRKFRIIVPSKNKYGKFNYYEARSYIPGPKEIPYIKPPGEEVHKSDIIFNEYFINWDLPIFLVEGVFDMFRVPNSIPILGKEISELLISQLKKHNSTVVLCLDDDAIKKTAEIYTLLSSLGLDVFYVDLTVYNKDISKIYEDHGKEEVAKALSNLQRLDLSLEVDKKLRDE